MRTSWQRIRLGAFVLGWIFLISVFGYRYLGGYGWIESLWMVVITISTVGYSESSQLPTSVQLWSILVILVGISAAAYTFGGLIQWIFEGELDHALGKRRMNKEIGGLSDHTIICGYGRMGRNLARELQEQNQKLVVIDADSDAIADAQASGLLCVQGDATEDATIESAGLARAKTLVSTFANDAESVFITLTARELNRSVRIIARAERESTRKKLHQAGADTIVMPTVVSARQMGRMITRPSTAHLINLVDEGSNRAFDLDELIVAPGSRLEGMTVQHTEAHRRHKLLVVAIKTRSGELKFNPDADVAFEQGEVLMVMGSRNDIDNFRSEFNV